MTRPGVTVTMHVPGYVTGYEPVCNRVCNPAPDPTRPVYNSSKSFIVTVCRARVSDGLRLDR